MLKKDALVLASALALFLGVGYVALAPSSSANELPPDAVPSTPAVTPAVPAVMTEAMTPVQAQGGAVGRHAGHAADGDSIRPDTAGWTSGVIAGDIALVASIVRDIQTIQIYIEELRPPTDGSGNFQPRFSKVVPVARGVGTPTFRVDGIPFSAYGYTVTVHSPGLNGTRQTVAITEQSPLVDDVQLAITPGVPFSVLLRDQDNQSYTMLDVRLQPVGEPLGRPVRVGAADALGCAIFENVLAGDYLVHVGDLAAPLADPVPVTVHATARVYGGTTVQAQGQTITIPRGVPLPVQISDLRGYGIPEVLVQLQALDRRELKVLERQTDGLGRASFPNVPAGVWQLTAIKDGFQRTFRNVTIKDATPPATETFQLVRLR